MKNRIRNPVTLQVVGIEEKHQHLCKKLADDILELITNEFEPLSESSEWNACEAAACALRALQELMASILDMMARNCRDVDYEDEDHPKPALTEAEYDAFMDDLKIVIQNHVNKISSHLINDN